MRRHISTIRIGAALLCLLMGGRTPAADTYDWQLEDGRVISAEYVAFIDGVVTIEHEDGHAQKLGFNEFTSEDQQHVLRLEDTDRPRSSPPWPPGYSVRFPLRILGESGDAADFLVAQSARTVMASIPTGGWLQNDARDLMVTTVTGRKLPMAVLAHDPRGDTVIQFTRNGYDRWYWVYAVNPDAPGPEPEVARRIEAARLAAEQAVLAKMAALKESSLRAEQYRTIFLAVDEHHQTGRRFQRELAEWAKLLPERIETAETAKAKLLAASEALRLAEEADTPFRRIADEKTAEAERLKKEAAAAKEAGEDAIAAEQRVAAEAAADQARAARLAAAPSGTARTRAEKALVELTESVRAAEESVAAAKKRIEEANVRKSRIEQALGELDPKRVPARHAYKAARDAARQAVRDTKAAADAYFEVAVQSDPRMLKEGLTVEYRRWKGDKLDNWAAIFEGLQRSDNVIGSAILSQVHQHLNPFRRSDPRHFAASYLGCLNIEQAGVYRFFVNSDDAVFLFINGYRVFSRPGSNRPVQGKIPKFSIGTDIELDKGHHPFEIHQVVGDAPEAVGLCKIRWMRPGRYDWEYVPADAYTRALTAVAIDVEAFDGGQVAVLDHGMDDTLSSDGVTLYLSRFEAQGSVTDPDRLVWDFGDGTTGRGRSPAHVYFDAGNYDVTLRSHPKLKPFHRRCHQWVSDLPTSPHSLPKAVAVLHSMEIEKLDTATLNAMFHFLLICEQDTRWPLMERLCRHLLERKGLDIKYRAHLYTSLLQAVAEQGRGDEALKLIDAALGGVEHIRTLRALILLHAGDVNRDLLRDFSEADRLYFRVVDENRRLRHPLIREAAVAWGDMFLETGRLAEAGDAFRLARQLGAVGLIPEAQGDATKRGALLRVAEQQLRGGEIRQTRRLLQQIEFQFPEQRIEALYRFLRGEAERHAGQYERAIRNYEVVLQLPQGKSYRPQVLSGIADAHYRLGESKVTLSWLSELASAYPDFYKRQRLGQYRDKVQRRLGRFKRSASEGTIGGPAPFAGIETGFEPDEENPSDRPSGARLVPALGIDGPRTVFVEMRGSRRVRLPIQRMRNLPAQGSLWIELWYRERVGMGTGRGNYRIHVDVREETGRHIGGEELWPYRTYGQWYKLGFNLKAPSTLDGSVAITFQGNGALLEIDGLKILPVSDRLNDALRVFIEGADPQ